jgi:hypothetical protein
MAAIAALQHNPDIKIQNQRLLKNGKSKMSALFEVHYKKCPAEKGWLLKITE